MRAHDVEIGRRVGHALAVELFKVVRNLGTGDGSRPSAYGFRIGGFANQANFLTRFDFAVLDRGELGGLGLVVHSETAIGLSLRRWGCRRCRLNRPGLVHRTRSRPHSPSPRSRLQPAVPKRRQPGARNEKRLDWKCEADEAEEDPKGAHHTTSPNSCRISPYYCWMTAPFAVHLLQDGEALEFGMAEIERLACARAGMGLAKGVRPRPIEKLRLPSATASARRTARDRRAQGLSGGERR